MKRILRRLPVALALLLIASLLAYGYWPQAVEVDLASAERGSLEVTVNDDGKTRIREKYVVSAPVSGKLLRIELHAGDAVRRGETVLARIQPGDPSLLDTRARAQAEARVRAAEAAWHQSQMSLKRAQDSSELAEHDYERALQLIQSQGISQADFEEAEHQQHIAQVDLRYAEFGLNFAEFELQLAQAALIHAEQSGDEPQGYSPFIITAPTSGKVLRVFQESSAVVSPGDVLLEVGDPENLEMEIDVLSTDAVRIRPGAPVYVEHWGGPQMLHGVVRVVEPSAFLKVSALGVEEQRVNVIADFTDPVEQRPTLLDEFRIEARIVVAERRDVVKVPAGALFREGKQWRLYAVVDGRARLRAVEPGQSNELETEIVEGVSPGEQLIVHPSDQIREGVRVRAAGIR